MGNTRLGIPNSPKPFKSGSDDGPLNGAASASDSLAVFAFLSQEIQAKMGKDFLGKMPIDKMERYCLATVENGHPTSQMLFELVTNFLEAYSNPDTNEGALKALDFLAYQAEQARL